MSRRRVVRVSSSYGFDANWNRQTDRHDHVLSQAEALPKNPLLWSNSQLQNNLNKLITPTEQVLPTCQLIDKK